MAMHSKLGKRRTHLMQGKKRGSQTGIALEQSQTGKRPTVINLAKYGRTIHYFQPIP